MAVVWAENAGPLIDALMKSAGAWKNPTLPGVWQPVAGPVGLTRKEMRSSEPVFDVAAERLVATETAGKLTRLDVLLMERGTQAADAAYLQTMRQTAAKVSAAVQAKAGKPGQLVKAAGAVPGTVIQEWTTAASSIRLTMEPGVRLWVSISAQQSPAAGATASLKDTLKTHVQQKENGDVLITDLPEVARENEDRPGDNELRASECLASYYGWTIDVEATARTTGWKPEFNMDHSPEVFAAVAKAAKVRTETTKKLELLQVQHSIDRGQPPVYTHVYSDIRSEYLRDFAKRYAADPSLELPSPKDPEERKKWPVATDNTDYYICTALIIGYNKKRGELILMYPGHAPEVRTLRVREEEVVVSQEETYFIRPN
jgi:hypothetical protein